MFFFRTGTGEFSLPFPSWISGRCCLSKVQQFLVINIAGGGDNYIIGTVHLIFKGDYFVPGQTCYGVLVSKDGHPERVVFPEALMENIVYKIIRVILHHVDFLENNLALFLYFLRDQRLN